MGDIKIKVVLRPNKINKSGRIPIAYRFTKNRKSTFIFSGITVLEEEWNPFDSFLWEKKPTLNYFKTRKLVFPYDDIGFLHSYIKKIRINPFAESYNQKIGNQLRDFYAKINELKILNRSVTASSFKLGIIEKNHEGKEGSFIAYWKKRTQYFIDSESSSWRAYSDTFSIFSKFVNGKDVKFSDIDIDFVNNFNAYLKRQRKKDGVTPWSDDYIYKIAKTARAVYNQAIKDGVYESDKNPFAKRITRPQKSRTKEKLTKEEIKSIQKLDLEKGSTIWDAKNCFLFAIYNGGMRVGDVLRIKWENIKGDRIYYKMEKNDKFSDLPLSNHSKKILELYKSNNKASSSFVFPFLSGCEKKNDFLALNRKKESSIAYINTLLKTIAEKAGISKNISTHVARHSYTGIAIESNTNPAVIKDILKHGSQKVTDGYIGEIANEQKDNAHRKIMNALK